MNKLNAFMKEQGLDALYISSEPNVQYVSGYTADGAYCVVLPDKIYLVTDFRYAEMAEKQSSGRYETICAKRTEFYPRIGELLRDANAVGVEKDSITVNAFDKLCEYVKAETKDISSAMQKLRAVKTPDELAIMREGAKLTEEAMERIIKLAKPGVSEKDLDCELKYIFGKLGTRPSFAPIIASGENSSMPHAVPTDRKLRAGDLLTIDMGLIYRGLCTDMTRTFAISGVDEWQKTLYNTVKSAHEAVAAGICSGITGRAADKLARDIVEAAYPGCFEHGLGHGVGIEIHEEPVLNSLSDTELTQGMVFTNEPGAYLAGRGGVRIEDMAVIDENGRYASFYSFTKDLIIL